MFFQGCRPPSIFLREKAMRSLTVRFLKFLCLSVIGGIQTNAAPTEKTVVLFDGSGTNLFVSSTGSASDWRVEDGALVSTPNTRRSNNLVSRLHFRDAEIELEFLQPSDTDGNSGVFLHGLYEIQILTTKGKQKLTNRDMGAIYGLYAPLVNADQGSGKWQTLKILFHAPRRDESGQLTAEGSITAWLNGEKIHDDAKVGNQGSEYNPYAYDTTAYLAEIQRIENFKGTGPLLLQDHDCPVRFRQILVKPLDEAAYLYSPAMKNSHGLPQQND